MSDILFNCPECGHSLTVDSAGAGLNVPCPECKKQISIPIPPPSPPSNEEKDPSLVMDISPQKGLLPVISLVLGILGLWFMGLLAAIPAVICAHIARAQARENQSTNDQKLATLGLAVGYMAVLTVLIGPCGVAGHKWAGNDNEAAAPAPIITAEAYKQKLQVEFNSTYDGTFMPQAVFEWVHPLGTASRIVVHDVSLSWKNGQASNSVNDLLSWTARLTVYWSAILVTDGYTKLQITYDNEAERITALSILSTNGQTHDEVNQAAWGIGYLIGRMLTL